MADAELALLDLFYNAFDRGDGATMAACYAPDARFADPVFPTCAAPSQVPCGGC